MKKIVALGVAVLVVAAVVVLVKLDATSSDGVFHPDHNRVFNGFQDATSAVTSGGTSSVPPDSECRQLDESTWRCYRRWAPAGRPRAAEVLEAEVTVYDDRIVVGDISRRAD